jgi:type VI secretion system secreted protein VgrG
MAITLSSSKESFLFTTSRTSSHLSVVSFTISEKISYYFSSQVELAATSEIKTFDNIIGQECLLTVINNDRLSGGDRYFHGKVRKFEHTGMSGRKFLYEAEVVPSIYFLSLRRNCRIFQETTTHEIIKTILEEAGITSDSYRFALENFDRKRGFCVQYQESDLDFISRLMEEEGIYYFFEHYKDKHVMVMCDSMSVHLPLNGNPSITCNSGNGLVADKESVSHFTFSQRRTPEAFAHSNFFFKKPDLDLTRKKTGAQQTRYEIYEYAALHTTQAHGDILAEVRMQQLVALRKQGHGQSSSCRLIPGYKFTLADHEANSLNVEYLITDVSHAGSQPQVLEENACGSASYANSFTVIPATIQYRPPLITPKPIVTGLQTAIVVGPKGEEIHTDEHGRVRVQFHWDRDGERNERSSCWLRVAQAWGGLSRGGQFIPRIGDEVLVDFLEGNPDRPIITGSVYNSDNMPINNLKKSITQSGFRTKTHKGSGFHELRFDDAKGKEEIYLQSEKDWNILVKNRRGETVGGDSGTVVGKNRDLSVGGDSFTIIKGKSTEKAKEIIVGADDNISIVSGASSIVITPEGIKINGPIVSINDGSKAPEPLEKPVSGCTGKGGGSSSGGSVSPSKTPSSTAVSSPPQLPEQAEKKDPVASNEAPPLDEFKGNVPSGGWAGSPTVNDMPIDEVWKIGSVSDNVSGLGDLVSSRTSSPLLNGIRLPAAGDLVSSATTSSPGNLMDNATRIGSIAQNPESMKNTVITEAQKRVTRELDNSKSKLLGTKGISDAQIEAEQELAKLRSLLSSPKVNRNDVLKKF